MQHGRCNSRSAHVRLRQASVVVGSLFNEGELDFSLHSRLRYLPTVTYCHKRPTKLFLYLREARCTCIYLVYIYTHIHKAMLTSLQCHSQNSGNECMFLRTRNISKHSLVAVIIMLRSQSVTHEFVCIVVLLHTACCVWHIPSNTDITKSSTHLLVINLAWSNIRVHVSRVSLYMMIIFHNKLWDLQVNMLQ